MILGDLINEHKNILHTQEFRKISKQRGLIFDSIFQHALNCACNEG